MKPVVTFGEIMGRMAAPENIRLRQTRVNGTNLCRGLKPVLQHPYAILEATRDMLLHYQSMH